MVIRTSTSYRIVSHTALCVLTGTMSLHLKAVLRTESYELRKIGYQERYNICSRTRGSTSTSIERARRIE